MAHSPILINLASNDDPQLGLETHKTGAPPPFDFYLYRNLLDQGTFDQLRCDLNSKIHLEQKNNDLYRFKQSKDLKCQLATEQLTPLINSFVSSMLTKVSYHIEKKFGIKLSKQTFDITASRYDVGDYLLCHNDDIKDSSQKSARALAFIFYLNSRSWNHQDGGALILYDTDDKGEPVTINSRLYPAPNSLAVFKTSHKSWHAVEEVYCTDDTRLSINGWFHYDENECQSTADEIKRAAEHSLEPCPYDFFRPNPLNDMTERFFKDCINNEYLMGKTRYLIRRKFKRNSEINLNNFLVKERFQEISQALKLAAEDENNLQQVGPYNKRNYQRFKLANLPPICQDLLEAFRSELFFMLLSRLTGLDLQPPSLIHGEEIKETDATSDEDEDDDSDESDDEESTGDSSSDSCDAIVGAESERHGNDGDEDSSESENNGERDESISRQEKARPAEGDKLPERKGAHDSGDTLESSNKRKRNNDPLARLEFRHLQHGSYTLVHDYAYEVGERSALDVTLHFNHDFRVNFDNGGYISYIDGSTESPDEEAIDQKDCELLTIEPRSNCLSLVYREDGSTCRFLKYISRSHTSDYQDLHCVFYERPDDLPENTPNPSQGRTK